MIYLVFDTLKAAENALRQIDYKVRAIIQNNNSQAIDLSGIIPRSAATGELMPNATKTTTWAVIQKTDLGKFVFPKITENHHPLFKGINFLGGISGYSEAEYNPNWFLLTNINGSLN